MDKVQDFQIALPALAEELLNSRTNPV
jgi:hypothetical protein